MAVTNLGLFSISLILDSFSSPGGDGAVVFSEDNRPMFFCSSIDSSARQFIVSRHSFLARVEFAEGCVFVRVLF